MSTSPEAPDACTLALVHRPERVERWDSLFARRARSVHRASTTHTTIELAAAPDAAAEAADLAMREAGCCSFFDFTIHAASGRLRLEITVPQRYADVLAGLSGRAEAAAAT